jgi:hypothetical protein
MLHFTKEYLASSLIIKNPFSKEANGEASSLLFAN